MHIRQCPVAEPLPNSLESDRSWRVKRIVALTGYVGAGKSTAASSLVAEHGFARRPFSFPLKNMLRAIGLSETELDGTAKEEPVEWLLGLTPRRLMQTLGTEWGRDTIHPDLWVHLWRRQVERASSPVVADDLRFPNEEAAVRVMGGIVVRVVRDGIRSSAHPSEYSIDNLKPDAIVRNDGTPAELAATLLEIVR